ncbi:hypothetical protein PRLR5107_18900 [Prevotella lacticifex]|jgi:ATP-binding cassette subfamily B protein|uniref:ABC transporter domain-containing protein n=1 Tax=Prevotella lacticifex TaxID=2854755 RepID=A0A9R1CYX9_9BACT|nr:hypothetical protein PRLR5003_13330 [Prevotella lacticifex]GJG38773.1 hypothetical protein PRLR5019_07440 [Prevotella lacticifex]GJG42545.1 hypothetical protein PRLR5025_13310 [Prevotella lacticifex]GJG45129.1 hypothetical protein PRLR5027_07240 [Prevotella lacticifex]GJG48896.1 hypothetical protein PRLR5052_13090 [Prevotella lacticifex]
MKEKYRIETIKKAEMLDGYVMSLPLKYNTKIGRDGMGLSQGQLQRILIARAVYKNPGYIFLDEATNSLDANNERAIVENLDTFYRGKTVVIVAHHLSTVRNADQIVVIDHGMVVETGNHETLTAKRGAYYNLVKNQLELMVSHFSWRNARDSSIPSKVNVLMVVSSPSLLSRRNESMSPGNGR